MKVLVLYDSVFGNTKLIAEAISQALSSELNHVSIMKVKDVPAIQLTGVDLLIVGSPTRGFRPTKELNELLEKIPAKGLKGIRVLAFDTRISTTDVNNRFLNVMVRLFGYAAKPIADKLKKKGGDLILPPEGFYVKESEGPLKDGELERAANWAKKALS